MGWDGSWGRRQCLWSGEWDLRDPQINWDAVLLRYLNTRWIRNVSTRFAASRVGSGTGGGDRALSVHGSSSREVGSKKETYCKRSNVQKKKTFKLNTCTELTNAELCGIQIISATTAIVRHEYWIMTPKTRREFFWTRDRMIFTVTINPTGAVKSDSSQCSSAQAQALSAQTRTRLVLDMLHDYFGYAN